MKKNQNNKFYFLKLIVRFSPYLFFGAAVLVVINWYQLRIPELFREILAIFKTNKVELTSKKIEVYSHITSILMLLGLLILGRFIWRFALFGTSRLVESKMRVDLFEKQTKQSQTHFKTTKTGALMAYFTQDINQIRMTVALSFLMLSDIIFLGGFTLYKMFTLSWAASTAFLVPLIFVFLVSLYFGRQMRMHFKTSRANYTIMQDFVQETFQGHVVIKAFLRETWAYAHFGVLAKNYSTAYSKSAKAGFKNQFFNQLITGLNLTVLIFTLSLIIIYPSKVFGKLQSEDMILFFTYVFTLSWPLMAIGHFVTMLSKTMVSRRVFLSALNKESETEVKPTKEVVFARYLKTNKNILATDLTSEIEFKNFNFVYPDDPKNLVLKDLNLKIKPGQTIGILGRTGSGKTTIGEILLKVYSSENGKCLIGGTDINILSQNTLAEQIGYVSQNGFLFSDTIAANVNFKNKYTDQVVLHKLYANFDLKNTLDNLEHGQNTKILENGKNLSGGEKQRISLARAFLNNPKILILDDALSALDMKTEQKILDSINKLKTPEMVVILISHRISSIMAADNIFILKNGTVADSGTHQELVLKNQEYSKLMQTQSMKGLE